MALAASQTSSSVETSAIVGAMVRNSSAKPSASARMVSAPPTAPWKRSTASPPRPAVSYSHSTPLMFRLFSVIPKSSGRTADDSVRRRAAQPLRRSEEHTSELQSRQYLVCRLLLEKKKNKSKYKH